MKPLNKTERIFFNSYNEMYYYMRKTEFLKCRPMTSKLDNKS